MTPTTSTIPLEPRRGVSAIGAALLTIAGNILVVAIIATAIAATGAAAVLVFGQGLTDLF